MYKYNKPLLSYIGASRIEELKHKSSDIWQSYLDEGIVKSDHCFYFSRSAPQGPFSTDLIDRTGNECFYNKIHIEDFFRGDHDNLFYLEEGITFSFMLAKKLEYFNDSFVVFLSYDGSFCIVCFHKKRNGEKWLKEELELYEDAMLVINTIDGPNIK